MFKHLATLALFGPLATASLLALPAQNKAAAAPSVVVQVEAPHTDANANGNNEDLGIQRKLAEYTKWLVIVTWFLAVVGGVQGYFLFRQARHLGEHASHLHSLAGAASDNAKAAQDTAQAALAQANHIVASERAWVLVGKVALTSGASDRPEGSKQVFIHCEAVNRGKSPARVLGLNARYAEGPIAEPERTWNERLYDFSGKSTPRWTFVPNVPRSLSDSIPGFFANPGDMLTAPPQPGHAQFIHGVIRYWDVFTETDRYTRFCYRLDGVGAPLGEGWHLAGGERCNQET